MQPLLAEGKIEVEKLSSFLKVKDSKMTSGFQAGTEVQLIFLSKLLAHWRSTDFKLSVFRFC